MIDVNYRFGSVDAIDSVASGPKRPKMVYMGGRYRFSSVKANSDAIDLVAYLYIYQDLRY